MISRVIGHKVNPMPLDNLIPKTYALPWKPDFQWELTPFLYLDHARKDQLTLLTYKRDESKCMAAKQAVHVIAFSPNHLVVEVNTPNAQLLYYADSYHKRWYCEVDGNLTQVLRANYAYKAVVVPAGKHVIKFYYDPLYAKISLILFYTSLVMVPLCTMIVFLMSWKNNGNYSGRENHTC
jgi:uncharacterized membrane protein YfhO